MSRRIIFETDNKKFRIVEHLDVHADIEDLKGDVYNFDVCGYTGTREELRAEEVEFEETVSLEGVYGYVLEKWNPEAGKGYETVDSCWGFIGQYDETDERHNHDIVAEMKETIKDKETKEADRE